MIGQDAVFMGNFAMFWVPMRRPGPPVYAMDGDDSIHEEYAAPWNELAGMAWRSSRSPSATATRVNSRVMEHLESSLAQRVASVRLVHKSRPSHADWTS